MHYKLDSLFPTLCLDLARWKLTASYLQHHYFCSCFHLVTQVLVSAILHNVVLSTVSNQSESVPLRNTHALCVSINTFYIMVKRSSAVQSRLSYISDSIWPTTMWLNLLSMLSAPMLLTMLQLIKSILSCLNMFHCLMASCVDCWIERVRCVVDVSLNQPGVAWSEAVALI